MRINISISMSGEVFAHRQYSSSFQTGSISDYLIGNLYRIFSERTGVDYRVLRVDIHIRHRSKIHLHTYLTALTGYFTPVFINQAIVTNASQHHIPWKHRCAAQTHRHPPFPVKSDHHRNFRLPLCPVG